MGKAFLWGIGALGRAGAAHVASETREALLEHMAQLGCARPEELAGLARRHPGAFGAESFDAARGAG